MENFKQLLIYYAAVRQTLATAKLPSDKQLFENNPLKVPSCESGSIYHGKWSKNSNVVQLEITMTPVSIDNNVFKGQVTKATIFLLHLPRSATLSQRSQ